MHPRKRYPNQLSASRWRQSPWFAVLQAAALAAILVQLAVATFHPPLLQKAWTIDAFPSSALGLEFPVCAHAAEASDVGAPAGDPRQRHDASCQICPLCQLLHHLSGIPPAAVLLSLPAWQAIGKFARRTKQDLVRAAPIIAAQPRAPPASI